MMEKVRWPRSPGGITDSVPTPWRPERPHLSLGLGSPILTKRILSYRLSPWRLGRRSGCWVDTVKAMWRALSEVPGLEVHCGLSPWLQDLSVLLERPMAGR